MESDNDFVMRVDAEPDTQASPAATPDLYTNYTRAPEAIVDPHHDSAIFGETQQDGQSHYDYLNSFDSRGSQRQGPPHYAPRTNFVVDRSNSIPPNDLTSGFPGIGPGFHYSQPASAVDSAVDVPWEVASTPDVINVTGNLYPFGVPEFSIVPFATALYPGLPDLDAGFTTWDEDGENVTLSMQNTYTGWLSTDAFDYWDYITAQAASGDLSQEVLAGYDGSDRPATPALFDTGGLPQNATIVNDGSDYSAARAVYASTVYGGYDGSYIFKQEDSDHAFNLNFGALAVEDSSGAFVGRPPPVVDTPALPAFSYSKGHGAIVGAGASSTQEAPTSFPAVPSAAPLVPERSSPVSGNAEKPSPLTEVIHNERGEALLVCACGDTFSPEPSAVDHHYDEKHAVAGCCPWKSKGCTSRAQNIKEHIRDKHCRTCFICPVCLRSDFSCDRSMKKHRTACRREEAGIVFCGHCLTAWPSRAALAVHAPLCPSTLDRHPEHRQ